LLGAVLLLAAPASAQDGRAIFDARCASCHAVQEGAPPGPGPNLRAIHGRRVAGDAAFDYSPVLREAGQAGDTWDTGRLTQFLADPEEMYPGLWMGGNGLRSEAERRAVVEWLASSERGR
jgi:cytochrome c